MTQGLDSAFSWGQNNPPQHGFCLAYVASHSRAYPEYYGSAGRYNLSPDIVECDVEKTFKGNTASLTLAPRKPYTHFIFNGDHISIYMGTGAKHPQGFGIFGRKSSAEDEIRVFVGVIDSVRESVSVDDSSGKVSVRFALSCSGVVKALERTQIYFNQNLSPSSLFGAVLPGLADLTQGAGGGGIPLMGSPTTLVRGIALAYVGFGGQFLLPESYPLRISSPQDRIKYLRSSIDRALALESAIGLQQARGGGKAPEVLGLVQQMARRNLENIQANSVLNLLDVFSQVEDFFVDGFVHRAPFHDLQGSVWGLMQENCNPMLNELYVAMLPAKKDNQSVSIEVDEWGHAPAYVPTMVMRERPFGTSTLIHRVPITSEKTERDFYFGDVFFSDVANPSLMPRLQRSQSNTSPTDPNKLGAQGYGYRHVDRIQLRLQDLGTESLGTSDNDHFNFFTISSAALVLQAQDQKFMLLQDGLVPMFNEESIKRYGLRVRELQTKYMHTGAATIQSSSAMTFLIRSLLLQDHWYQLAPWYRAGTLNIRPLPEAEIGMCVDIEYPRNETFYVEGVKQRFTQTEQGGKITTSLTVTRGQPSGFADAGERFWYGAPHVVKLYLPKSSTDLTAGQEIARPQSRFQPQRSANANSLLGRQQGIDYTKVNQVLDNAKTQTSAEKILDVTRYFETNEAYYKISSYANWNKNDVGQGISFGFIQFNQKRGTLPDLFQAMHNANPVKFSALFGAFATNMLNVSWVRTTDLNALAGFKPLLVQSGLDPFYQRVQRDLAILRYFNPAVKIASEFVQITERAACMAFDICVQFGDKRVRLFFQKALKRAKDKSPNYETKDVLRELVAIADVEFLRSLGFKTEYRRDRIFNGIVPAKYITDELLSATKPQETKQTVTTDGRKIEETKAVGAGGASTTNTKETQVVRTNAQGQSTTAGQTSPTNTQASTAQTAKQNNQNAIVAASSVSLPIGISIKEDRQQMGGPPWALRGWIGKMWTAARIWSKPSVESIERKNKGK